MVDFSEARKVLLGGGSPSSDTETHTCKVNGVLLNLLYFLQSFDLLPPPQHHVSFLSLEMSSSSCQVILLPLSFFFSVVWLPRPMVIFPALFAPLTIVLDSVLWGVQGSCSFSNKTGGCVNIFRGETNRNNQSVSPELVATELHHKPEASVPLFLLWKDELRCCLSCCKSKGAEDGLWVADPLEVLSEDLHHLWAHLLVKSHFYQLEEILAKLII